MKRILSLIIILSMSPMYVYALGLGKLELDSALNEPFNAKIGLLSPTASELDSLNIGLADSDAFARAGIDRPFILSLLKFKLVRSETGADFISVTSQEPIREPFLNFLIEVNWSNGRLFREYTVLLDPPMYDPNARASKFVAKQPSMPAPIQVEEPAHDVVYADDFASYESDAGTAPSPVVNYTGGDYGPTAANDTLWSIASETRPDASVSVNQMMLALLRANPDAFLNNNINGLKRGQILKMPSDDEIGASSQAEALAEVNSQYAAWEQLKDSLGSGGAVTERVASSSAGTDTDMTASSVTSEADDAELRLVAASDEAGNTQQVSSVEGVEGMALAQESIQALTQENLDLKDQLQESEALLGDLKRLLELKDDELAALQQQLGIEETEITVEEMPEVVETVEEEIDAAEEVVEEETAEVIETVEEATEQPVEEQVMDVTETVDEEIAEVTEEVEEMADEPLDEEAIEVIEIEPAPESAGIMGMVETYLAPITDMLGGNPLYAIAALGLLIVLIIIAVAAKFRKKGDASTSTEGATAEAFPEFDAGTDDLDAAEEELDSEAATVLPDSEDETFIPGDDAEDNSEDETYLPGGDEDEAAEEADDKTMIVAAEEEDEDEEDPLQEVNTYLAFEQFDQAEEFVRNAINDKPDNAEYHTKLLEVFYTSGNKKSYEEEAKVLNELVGGEGEHWDMAVAMWSEMSPNRALFEAGGDDEDEAADADTTGGFVDVTADDEAQEDDAGLDFDIGAGDESAEKENKVSDDDLLDITAAEEGEDVLDVTSSDEGEEDILDVTAAVGLDEADGVDDVESEEEVLDISASNDGEDLLDVTAAGTAADADLDDDVLDISSAGSDDVLDATKAEDASEDLLDVTAASDLDLDSEEDLLDVTSATSAGADSDELLDLDIEDSSSEAGEGEETADEDNVIDFDLAAASDNEADAEASDSDDSLEDGLELNLDESDTEEDGLELDLGDTADADDEGGLELDMDSSESSDADAEVEDEISLDMELDAGEGDSDDDLSIELDMGEADDASPEADASDDEEEPAMDFDLSLDVDEDDSEAEVDMDGTVELDAGALDIEDDDDDDDEDSTVFVPRAAQPDEQSAEDEIATKLDLAKAYVELGDKDSAKTILDEVMADGNDEQKQQAQDLLSQV